MRTSKTCARASKTLAKAFLIWCQDVRHLEHGSNGTSGLQSHLRPFQKFRYVSTKCAGGRTIIWSRFFKSAPVCVFFAPICARFADLLHHVSNRDKMQKTEKCSNQWFLLWTFLCITKTTFTLRKIDLHIEQAVGHKFASRWRFLVINKQRTNVRALR